MPNHLPKSTQGGASAVPTAANNTGGGSGWGDEGFFKGGGGSDSKESVSSISCLFVGCCSGSEADICICWVHVAGWWKLCLWRTLVCET